MTESSTIEAPESVNIDGIQFVRGSTVAKALGLTDRSVYRYSLLWEEDRDAGIPVEERRGIPVAYYLPGGGQGQRMYSLAAVMRKMKFDPEAL